MHSKLAFSPLAFLLAVPAQDRGTPPEHGRVHWSRDLEAARSSGAPCFVLFQEVPG